MERTSSRTSSKSSKSSDRLIDRILNRFKMIKRNSRSSITDIQKSIEYPSCSSDQQYEDFTDYQYDWQYRKIAPEDLQPFCDQLEKFLKYVRNFQELTYLTYDYPSMLQNRLAKDANELQCLFLEVKDAVNNIERLKQQKKSVRKEKSSVRTALKKIREEEIREMENIIALYDKTMYARWENVKNTHKPEVLEILLNDVKGKQQALEHLNTLLSRKLGQLQIFMPLLASTENAAAAVLAKTPAITMTAGAANNAKTSGSNGTDNSTDDNKLQGNQGSKRLVNSGNSSRTTESHRANVRRRRHHERQENFNNGRFISPTLQQESSNNDLPLIPFTMNNSPFQIATFTVPLNTTVETNPGSNSNHELLTVSSNTNTADMLRNENNNNDLSTAVGSEFQSEMRTVLQALFGELRQTSPTTITINNTDEENTDNTHREIELYTLRRPTP